MGDHFPWSIIANSPAAVQIVAQKYDKYAREVWHCFLCTLLKKQNGQSLNSQSDLRVIDALRKLAYLVAFWLYQLLIQKKNNFGGHIRYIDEKSNLKAQVIFWVVHSKNVNSLRLLPFQTENAPSSKIKFGAI